MYIHNFDCLDSTGENDHTFSHQEHTKFTKRYENGYDIKTDQRYNKWLEIYHPTDSQCIHGNCLTKCVIYKMICAQSYVAMYCRHFY